MKSHQREIENINETLVTLKQTTERKEFNLILKYKNNLQTPRVNMAFYHLRSIYLGFYTTPIAMVSVGWFTLKNYNGIVRSLRGMKNSHPRKTKLCQPNPVVARAWSTEESFH